MHENLEKEKETTWHIHLQGLVQGVGFRPFVYQLAVRERLTGTVSNGLDGLHIWINAPETNAKSFYENLVHHHPALSRITGHSIQQEAEQHFMGFSISEASIQIAPNLWITPDLALCEICRDELYDPTNRRYQYPFITCTQCGPRYSIMQDLPFDRHLTAMQDFPMCDACRHEYDVPADRRFYAQTISCGTCGVQMEWIDEQGKKTDAPADLLISTMVTRLQEGNIIAVKGIGGFLLMVDASNEVAIETLRRRKHRPAKPFAILYPSLAQLQQDTELNDACRDALQCIEAPIVLVPIGDGMRKKLAVDALAPGLDKIGVMLPYAPLLEWIAHAFGKPLVATSANISGAPIFYNNEEAISGLKGIANYFLVHNRDIVAPQDDSVLALTPKSQIPILLRRSRGWAPAFPQFKSPENETILATGALLKSSFTIAHQQQVYISQYLGSTESYEAQQTYRHTLRHLQSLLQARPAVILTDLHPQYFSHLLAKEIASTYNLPCYEIQHHKAHFAAILGEYGLTKSKEPILGIIWDGTGLGDDGQSWGGEFFMYEKGEMNRGHHFDYFPYLLGDKMAKEPRLAALSGLHPNIAAFPGLKEKFTESEWKIYNNLLVHYSGIRTSSVGRIFDAVACLLLGIDKQSYEGEAAMLLEVAGRKWCTEKGYEIGESYFEDYLPGSAIQVKELLLELVADLHAGKNRDWIAAKFHYSLAHLIDIIATQLSIQTIACSGGVFQNSLLVDMVHAHCAPKYTLYFHKHLSPNDENISFGQLVYYCEKITINKE